MDRRTTKITTSSQGVLSTSLHAQCHEEFVSVTLYSRRMSARHGRHVPSVNIQCPTPGKLDPRHRKRKLNPGLSQQFSPRRLLSVWQFSSWELTGMSPIALLSTVMCNRDHGPTSAHPIPVQRHQPTLFPKQFGMTRAPIKMYAFIHSIPCRVERPQVPRPASLSRKSLYSLIQQMRSTHFGRYCEQCRITWTDMRGGGITLIPWERGCITHAEQAHTNSISCPGDSVVFVKLHLIRTGCCTGRNFV